MLGSIHNVKTVYLLQTLSKEVTLFILFNILSIIDNNLFYVEGIEQSGARREREIHSKES